MTKTKFYINSNSVTKICAFSIIASFFLRRSGEQLPDWSNFILGIIPNFFATPFVMNIFRKYVFQIAKRWPINSAESLNYIITVLSLILYEYIRFWTSEHPVDLYDIYASILSGGIYVFAIRVRMVEMDNGKD